MHSFRRFVTVSFLALTLAACGGSPALVPHPSPEPTGTVAPTTEPQPSPTEGTTVDLGFAMGMGAAGGRLYSYRVDRSTGTLDEVGAANVSGKALADFVPLPSGTSLLETQSPAASTGRVQISAVASDGVLVDEAAFDFPSAKTPLLTAGGRYAYTYVPNLAPATDGTLYSINVDKSLPDFGSVVPFDRPDALTALAFSVKTKLLYTTQGGDRLVTYAFATPGKGTQVGNIGGYQGAVQTVALSGGDRVLFVVTRLASEARLYAFVIGDDGAPWLGGSTRLAYDDPTGLAAHPSADYACVSALQGLQVLSVDPANGRLTATLEAKMQQPANGVAFEPSGRFLYASRPDGIWGYVFDAQVGSLLDLGRQTTTPSGRTIFGRRAIH